MPKLAFEKVNKLQLLTMVQNLKASDETWTEIYQLNMKYLSRRLIEMANKVADENGWTDEDFDRMAHTHLRTPYRH